MDNMFDRPVFSRLASEEEIKQSLHRITFDGTNPGRGGLPLFTTENNEVYVEQEDIHTLIMGATGSKKSRLIGMPALHIYATAGESFVATDPKAELYKRTYPMLKKQGYGIFILNLRDPTRSDAWNPLLIPYLLYKEGKKDKAVEMVSDLANCIAKSGRSHDPYWENSASDLLMGLILILFEHAKENEVHFKSLRTLRTTAFINDKNGIPYIKDNYLNFLNVVSFLRTLLTGTVENADETRDCITSVFDQAMRPFFCQDSLLDTLSGSSLAMAETGKTKTAVFLIIPDENTVYNKLISVFVKQCYSELLREAENHPGTRLPVRVNFLLDEFATLPAISDFPAMITASRSRNIRFNLFIQSQHQLVQQYGDHAQTIKGNCENWVYLYSREYSMLDELACLSGMRHNEKPLISPIMLQTLSKEKGEAFILNKRLYPYVATLWDIDRYPKAAPEEAETPYPVQTCKADAVFDFKRYCEHNVGKYMTDENIIFEPVFTSSKPPDEVKKDTEEHTNEITLERYGSGVGQGWHGLLASIFTKFNQYYKKNKDKKIQIGEKKEKYGTLRFNVALKCPDYIKGMISIAEKESGHICEWCGARGETAEINKWYWTLCLNNAKAKKAAGAD